MSEWIRNLLAIAVGLACGSALSTALIELNFTVLFPPTEDLPSGDLAAFNDHIKALPSIAFIPVLMAHLSQALLGGWLAARLAASTPIRMALAVGFVSLCGGVLGLVMLDGPPWLAVELPLYIVVAWWAGDLEVRRRIRQASDSLQSMATRA